MTRGNEPPPATAAGLSPRIYQFDTRLAGGPEQWADHLGRVAAMQFDWVLVDGPARDAGFDQLAAFCANAQAAGLRVLGDAVPDRSDPDLAGPMHRLIEAGIAGFRCRHAHRLDAAAWSHLFADLRRQAPGTVFLGDAIGAPLNDLLALEPAGFDLVFNSACWWDFNAPWALEQYDLLRRFTRTVTFPESPYGPRLADTLGRLQPEMLEAAYRSRYAFAASFSAGVLMPMGFEYAAAGTLPGGWDAVRNAAPFDLSAYVGEVNELKESLPPLALESRIMRLDSPDAPLAALLHLDHELGSEAAGAVIVCLNPGYTPRRFTGLHRAVFALDGGIAALR
ncbi:MAG: hypothetical protein ACOC71_08305, partial [Hyphomicrobiales bacterium]